MANAGEGCPIKVILGIRDCFGGSCASAHWMVPMRACIVGFSQKVMLVRKTREGREEARLTSHKHRTSDIRVKKARASVSWQLKTTSITPGALMELWKPYAFPCVKEAPSKNENKPNHDNICPCREQRSYRVFCNPVKCRMCLGQVSETQERSFQPCCSYLNATQCPILGQPFLPTPLSGPLPALVSTPHRAPALALSSLPVP